MNTHKETTMTAGKNDECKLMNERGETIADPIV